MPAVAFGDPLCTQADAAALLGVSRSYVSQLIKGGRLATVEIRGRRRLLLKEVQRMARSRRERLEAELASMEG